MTNSYNSALFVGPVVHRRMRPKRHHLSYKVFALLLDLDELPLLERNCRLFGYNRRAVVSFWDRDHGDGTGDNLRGWIEAKLVEAGLTPDGGAIRVLCYPRILGYAFNPLTVYFSYRRDGTPAAILYEVSNTFRERHTYVIPVEDPEAPVIRQRCDKDFYVSPFLPMDCTYHFRIVVPGSSVAVAIRQEDADGLLLGASFNGRRRTFTAAALAAVLARYPAMALKVVAGIHWEALRLWLKRLPVHRHRAAPTQFGTTVIRNAAASHETGKAA